MKYFMEVLIVNQSLITRLKKKLTSAELFHIFLLPKCFALIFCKYMYIEEANTCQTVLNKMKRCRYINPSCQLWETKHAIPKVEPLCMKHILGSIVGITSAY